MADYLMFKGEQEYRLLTPEKVLSEEEQESQPGKLEEWISDIDEKVKTLRNIAILDRFQDSWNKNLEELEDRLRFMRDLYENLDIICTNIIRDRNESAGKPNSHYKSSLTDYLKTLKIIDLLIWHDAILLRENLVTTSGDSVAGDTIKIPELFPTNPMEFCDDRREEMEKFLQSKRLPVSSPKSILENQPQLMFAKSKPLIKKQNDLFDEEDTSCSCSIL